MVSRRVNVGILVPCTSGQALASPSAYREFFQQAESLGFHALWTVDRIFHSINVLDSLTLLTWAAASTERIRLGTAVLLFAFRNAVLVAKQAATLDYLSGGRLSLGISLGGSEREFKGLGVPIKERVARLRENITVLRRLLTGEPVTFQGRFYNLEGVSIRPRPVQRGGIPLVMGGRVDASLRRGVELTDGWMMGSTGMPEEFRAAWGKVQEDAHSLGKDPAQLDAGKLIYLAVDDDRDRARRLLQPYLHGYYSPSYDVDRFAIFGPPAEVAQRLQGFVDAGVKTLILGPPSPDAAHLRRLAQEVVAQLH